MYTLGEELSMNAIKKFMVNVQNIVSLPEPYYNKEGCFIIRFRTKVDRDVMLFRGSYTIYRRPMFLQVWTLEFSLQNDLLGVLPIWAMFPQLPLVFQGEKSIRKIATAIGKPIMTDKCTTKKLRVSYVKFLIKVDITRETRTKWQNLDNVEQEQNGNKNDRLHIPVRTL